ncbi:GLPGLI family protein [Marivirga tractuosa]|uniref:GLPGLI family protein n=1 Tax=Marivirga tractuosa TaxID=1006 RepID=UPI0035D125DE
MKIIVLTLLSLFLTNVASSQTVCVTYSEVKNVDEQLKKIPDPALRQKLKNDLTKPEYFVLHIKQPFSVYLPKVLEEIEGADNPMSQSQVKVMKFETDDPKVYKDFVNDTYLEKTNLIGKPFLIKDTIPQFNWKITNDTTSIGKFLCKKAIATNTTGKEIIAWFAAEIPISAGPAEYGGLPGLILRCASPTKEWEIESISMNVEIPNAVFAKPEEGKEVSFTEYNEIKTQKQKQLQSGQW